MSAGQESMEYHYDYEHDSGICTVNVTGDHKRPEDTVLLQQFARDFGKEHDCDCFLFDMTGATITGNFLDTFKAGTVPDDKDYMQIKQKVALLYLTITEDCKFLEDVAVNRGYQLRVFDQLEIAINWLKVS